MGADMIIKTKINGVGTPVAEDNSLTRSLGSRLVFPIFTMPSKEGLIIT